MESNVTWPQTFRHLEKVTRTSVDLFFLHCCWLEKREDTLQRVFTLSCLLCGIQRSHWCEMIQKLRSLLCLLLSRVCVSVLIWQTLALKGRDRSIGTQVALPFQTCSQVFLHRIITQNQSTEVECQINLSVCLVRCVQIRVWRRQIGENSFLKSLRLLRLNSLDSHVRTLNCSSLTSPHVGVFAGMLGISR